MANEWYCDENKVLDYNHYICWIFRALGSIKRIDQSINVLLQAQIVALLLFSWAFLSLPLELWLELFHGDFSTLRPFSAMDHDRNSPKNRYLSDPDESFNVVYGPDLEEVTSGAPFLPSASHHHATSSSRARDPSERNSHAWTLFQDAAANASKLYQGKIRVIVLFPLGCRGDVLGKEFVDAVFEIFLSFENFCKFNYQTCVLIIFSTILLATDELMEDKHIWFRYH